MAWLLDAGAATRDATQPRPCQRLPDPRQLPREELARGRRRAHLGLAFLHKGDPEAKQRMLTPHEAE
ncbi:MAG: hypothetical protein M3065_04320, partial [Actinomycetota bacterium]|nr:hypothetical protein [Actinomycetota bacterium]